jgi:hypothetical protein
MVDQGSEVEEGRTITCPNLRVWCNGGISILRVDAATSREPFFHIRNEVFSHKEVTHCFEIAQQAPHHCFLVHHSGLLLGMFLGLAMSQWTEAEHTEVIIQRIVLSGIIEERLYRLY